MLFKPSSPPLLGIDISTSSVKLIELAKTGNSYRVESFAAEPMPSNAITDKVIMDVDAAGDALRKAVKRASPGTKSAAVAISGQVMTKTIQMPAKLSDKDLGEQIELQADQYISQPIEEVAFDYEIVGPSQSDPELVDVLLVAARRESVDKLSSVLELAGLTAKVVDVEAFALENACKLLTYQMVDEGLDRTIALVDFGAATTNFSVLHDRKIIYTYSSDFGGKQLTEEIMRHYGLTYEEAGKAKKEGGLPGNYKVEILDPFADDMAQTVNRSLQFFLSSTSEYTHLDQIIVCGGCAGVPGAAERISEKMGTPAVIGNPFGQMKMSSRAKTQINPSDSPSLLVACGLALRSFD
ncbi:MAG TPA: pilus assembly protein PilM [Gammaproteobacteria bacterium]|nr:pilus assembly protein PilM [Gammaproteobacteria bacterium]